eukprot:GHVR01187939.1.p1 GENE.GHVR01187939.1~~GHVR01187939.1.p1  ORF type:complete len:261 (+),score=32.21 GHVR01187939.1:382-1164(+)
MRPQTQTAWGATVAAAFSSTYLKPNREAEDKKRGCFMPIKKFRGSVALADISDNTIVEQGDIAALAVDTGQLAADAIDGTKIEDDAVDSEHIAAGAIDLAHMSDESVDSDQYVDGSIDGVHFADNAITETLLAGPVVLHQKYQYDFADLGGAQAAIALTDDADGAQTIPDNAVIIRAYLSPITTAAGAGASIKLGFTGDDDAFLGVTAFDNGEFDAPTITELTAGIPTKTTAAVSVLATISGANLTGGKFNIFVDYFEGD